MHVEDVRAVPFSSVKGQRVEDNSNDMAMTAMTAVVVVGGYQKTRD